MSIYLTTDEITLRISQIQNRLGELSSNKEKIAFKFFTSESYDIRRQYINTYGADAENQYNINKRLAINDLDVKVRRYESELTELQFVLSEHKKIEAERLDAARRLLRSREIERIKAVESRREEIEAARFVPTFHHGGFTPHVGFVPMYRHDGVGVFAPFIPSPRSGFITPAHVLGMKSART